MIGRFEKRALVGYAAGAALAMSSLLASPALAQTKDDVRCEAIAKFCIYHWHSAGFASQDDCLNQDYDPQCGSSGGPDPRGDPQYGNPYADKTYECTDGSVTC